MWAPLRYHPEQARLWTSPARFKVVPAGRRSGKTELSKRKIITKAMAGTEYSCAKFFCGAPTRDQAKRIFWPDLKRYVPKEITAGTYESDLLLRLTNESEIYVIGFDKPERVEGTAWDGCILDEFGNMHEKVWGEHVRPALSDRKGWAWLIGVPEGRNHYYDIYLDALKDEFKEWDGFTWFSEDILPPEEIEAAKRDLDELTYQQEYCAQFVSFSGQTYYAFSNANVRRCSYDREADLIFALDFNINPGCANVIQEEADVDEYGFASYDKTITQIIDEIYIPRNSNTLKICEQFLQRYENHKGDVYVYGDSTGGAGGTGRVLGSDWDLVNQSLEPVFKDRYFFEVPRANPRERHRLNAVNSRIKTISGKRRLFVDPKCEYTIKDFYGVRSLDDGSIDKKKDPKLSHLTDGIGYYIHKEFPVISFMGGTIQVEGV